MRRLCERLKHRLGSRGFAIELLSFLLLPARPPIARLPNVSGCLPTLQRTNTGRRLPHGCSDTKSETIRVNHKVKIGNLCCTDNWDALRVCARPARGGSRAAALALHFVQPLGCPNFGVHLRCRLGIESASSNSSPRDLLALAGARDSQLTHFRRLKNRCLIHVGIKHSVSISKLSHNRFGDCRRGALPCSRCHPLPTCSEASQSLDQCLKSNHRPS